MGSKQGASWRSLIGRLGVSTVRRVLDSLVSAARRRVPWALVPALVRVRARLAELQEARMDVARGQMRFVFGEQLRPEELDNLARRQLVRASWLAEIRYHPDRATRQRVLGEENLRTALAAGQGCILSFMHHGDYEASFGSLARHGFSTQVVANPDIVGGHAKAWVRQTRKLLSQVPGVHPLDVTLGSSAIRDQLRRGQCVAVALDVPGSTYYNFLGRHLLMSSGGVRVAFELGCPVVAMSFAQSPAHAVGSADILLAPPLYPRDFGSAESLLEQLGQHFEQAVRQWPEGVAWQETEFRFLQNHDLADNLPDRSGSRRLEDATVTSFTFKSGQDLRALEPSR